MNVIYNKRLTLVAAVFLMATIGCHCFSRDDRNSSVAKASQEEAAVAQGKIIFLANCNRCHPGGEKGIGPSLSAKRLPAFLIKMQVRLGFGGMPSFSKEKISPAQLDELVLYIKALRKARQEKK